MDYLESISLHRIAPPEVSGTETAADLIDRAFSSYNAGRLREICRVFTAEAPPARLHGRPDALRRSDPRGAGDELPHPADQGRVRRLDRLDRSQPLSRHALRARPATAPEPAQPRRLRAAQHDVIRIYDIVFDYKTLLDTDSFYRELIQDEAFARPMGTAEFHHEVGRYLHGRAQALGQPSPSLLRRGVRGRRPDLHLEPGGQLDRDEPRRPEPARRPAPDRYAPRRQRDRGHRLRRQARWRQVGRPDPRRRQPQELHPPDRAPDPGSARPQRERPRLLPPDHRRPPGHRGTLGRDGQRGDDLGQGRPREASRLGDLLHRFDDRPAAPDGVRPGPTRPAAAPPVVPAAESRLRDAPHGLRNPTARGLLEARDRETVALSPFPRFRQADLPVSQRLSTVVLVIDPEEPDPAALEQAARILRRGGLVAFATETVYGLGALATDDQAAARIFAAKGRPALNPLIVHVAGVEQARACAADWPALGDVLAERFWPGPLTLVVNRGQRIPDIVSAGRSSVGLRVPAGTVARRLIEETGEPVAAPSANRSNRLSPTRAEHVLADLDGLIDLVLDSGPTSVGLESTVLDITVEPPRLLRPGPIAISELELVLKGRPVVVPSAGESAERPSSPGQLPIHYSPRTPSFRVETLEDLARVPPLEEIAIVSVGERLLPNGLPFGQVFRLEFDCESLTIAL